MWSRSEFSRTADQAEHQGGEPAPADAPREEGLCDGARDESDDDVSDHADQLATARARPYIVNRPESTLKCAVTGVVRRDRIW